MTHAICDWWSKILEEKGVWALFGVALGFVLGELSKWIRDARKRKRLKIALLDELDTNYHLIAQKKDILRDMIAALNESRILPGESVHSASTIYQTHLAQLFEFLKPKERDNLHVIYERLRQNDKFLDEFESRIKSDIDLQIMANPYFTYHTQLEEWLQSYDLVGILIKEFLAGDPKDVFYRHGKMGSAQNAS